MRELVTNFKNTFVFMKGHRVKYSFGIIGMTVSRCTAALLQAYLLQLFLKEGRVDSLLQIAGIFFMLIIYVLIIMLVLPVFQFWFNGQAKYGHGSVNKAVYHKYGDLKMQYFEEEHSGKLMSLILNDTWSIAAVFMRHFRRVAAAVITILVYLVPMFVLDYRITAVLLVISTVSMLVNVKMAAKIKATTKETQERNSDLTVILGNIIAGMSVIRIYQMYRKMLEQFSMANRQLSSAERKRTKMLCLLSVWQYVQYVLNLVLFLFIGSVLVKRGLSSYADILAIMSLQTALDENFNELGTYYPQFINGFAATERISEFLETEEEPEICRSTNAQPMNTPAYIDFSNVTFSYDGANNVLTDFNLQVREGEHIALIGESGCGKSTLTKLLLGLYEIQGGEICVAGQSISYMTLEQLRQLISYVPQEPELFHVSVMENIRYGKVTATDEEVITAAKKANADAFIRELEQGYDTIIGEQGDNLSGGQRQRIAIARALLKDAPIFIFDEATSALDNETERKINESIEVCGDKTIIVVAHRESALRNMDRIIDLTEGYSKPTSDMCPPVRHGKHDKVNFMERTNEWKKTQENKGTLIHRKEYTINGRSYVVDGKRVKMNPSEREISIGVLLSEKYGKKVELIPQVMYPQGIQTPDYLIDGERFDLKSPTGKGRNILYGLIAKKYKQAHNFVIDITDCPLSMEELEKQAECLYKSRRTGFLETIVFLKNGEIVKVLCRN